MLPFLLLDEKTQVPNFWPYEFKIIKKSEPPNRKDVLHKVGWMKAQAFEYLGKCLVMDLDCLILKSIDEIDELEKEIAMPIDSAFRTYQDWPEVGEELNAGLILQNSNKIWQQFQKLWNEKQSFSEITYFDELIFSCICRKLNGIILPEIYNTSWDVGDEHDLRKKASDPKTKILHFHGIRKLQLINFIKSVL